MSAIKLTPTRRGVRILQHGTVLSEVLNQPGPTHSVVDVLAATINAFSQARTLAILGFEGGGIVAPLRALNPQCAIEAVDISNRSFFIFKKHCSPWCHPIQLHVADAITWMRRTRRKFDGIVEDISLSERNEVVQPETVWTVLPWLAHQRLSQDGVAVFNLLKPEKLSWKTVLSEVARPFSAAHVVLLETFENRLIIAGNRARRTHDVGRRLRQELTQLQSRLANEISVRTLNGL